MSEHKVMTCPKCGGEMERGKVPQSTAYGFRFKVEGKFWGTNIIPFGCKNCGYIELYKEKEEG